MDDESNKRVLHFIPSMGGGGAERQLTYLARGLASAGWEVHVALLEGGPFLQELERSGAVIHVMRVAHNYDPRLFMRMSRVIDAVAPAVVQTWMPLMDIAGGFISSIKGVPWILSERSSNQDYLSRAKRLLRETSARRATAIVANSRAGERFWASRIPRGKRFVIENALPLLEIDGVLSSDATPYRRGEATKLIVAAGRYHPGKNYVTLVQALALAIREQDFSALLCGEGPTEPAIRAAIEVARLNDRVVVTGFRRDVWSLMKAADLFVSISHFEGRVNAAMEAAVCGLPLVLSDIPEHREMFDDDAAWFVDRSDVVRIAQTIVWVLAHPSEARSRSENAQRVARQWTIEAMTARYGAVYDEIAVNR